MENYKRMYLRLFDAVTSAIIILERTSEKEAIEILQKAQQEAKDIYISTDEF